MCFPLELDLDLRELVEEERLPRRFFSFLSLSSRISSRTSACASTTTCCCCWWEPAGSPGERVAHGDAMGVQSVSASSKTLGKRSSRSWSGMKEEGCSLRSSILETDDSDARRGHEG